MHYKECSLHFLSYIYHANDAGDLEEGTTFRWLRADAVDGSYTEIAGSNEYVYELQAVDEGKFIKFQVTVRDDQGNIGTPVQSDATGVIDAAVADAAQVYLEISETHVQPGDEFQVEIFISNVADLFGASIAIQLDPDLVTVITDADGRAVQPETFLKAIK